MHLHHLQGVFAFYLPLPFAKVRTLLKLQLNKISRLNVHMIVVE